MIAMKTKTLAIFMGVFTLIAVALFTVSQLMSGDIIRTPTFQIVGNFLSLGLVLSSAWFSFLLIKQGETNRRNNDETNTRAESFRNLSFIASNHTIVDFYESITISYESERYIKRLKESHDFKFYMLEKGINLDDVKTNFEDYIFLTIKIPIRVVVGTAIGSIQFKNIRMDRSDKVHHFVPCTKDFHALILYNEDAKRQEVSVNIIANKDKDFYTQDIVNPFTKIKLFLTMHSFLGVAVSGWTELYFTNPQNLETDGANKYKINSSQFQIVGLPVLKKSVDDDISML